MPMTFTVDTIKRGFKDTGIAGKLIHFEVMLKIFNTLVVPFVQLAHDLNNKGSTE